MGTDSVALGDVGFDGLSVKIASLATPGDLAPASVTDAVYELLGSL